MNRKSILKATALVVGLTLVSKALGFLKSIIQASYFGATIYTDAYNIANGFVSLGKIYSTTGINSANDILANTIYTIEGPFTISDLPDTLEHAGTIMTYSCRYDADASVNGMKYNTFTADGIIIATIRIESLTKENK